MGNLLVVVLSVVYYQTAPHNINSCEFYYGLLQNLHKFYGKYITFFEVNTKVVNGLRCVQFGCGSGIRLVEWVSENSEYFNGEKIQLWIELISNVRELVCMYVYMSRFFLNFLSNFASHWDCALTNLSPELCFALARFELSTFFIIAGCLLNCALHCPTSMIAWCSTNISDSLESNQIN